MNLATETTIDRDREFDQTARTEPEHRNVSPAIWEHRYLTEKQRRIRADEVNTELTSKCIDLSDRLNVALDRIAGFERILAAVTAKVDEMIAAADSKHSGDRVEGYLWTARDNVFEYCPSCQTRGVTAAERSRNGDKTVKVFCCKCSRIISKLPDREDK